MAGRRRRWWRQGIMAEVVTMLIDAARQDPAISRYEVFPNQGPKPQDCLMFAKAVR